MKIMGEKTNKPKKGLGRGLGDLLAQHDTDLPFLSAYGEATGEHEKGVPASAGQDNSDELFDVCHRFLISTSGTENLKLHKKKISVGDWLVVSKSKTNGIELHVVGINLPLVPSDLVTPGMVDGALSEDRSEATVCIIQWGLEARRLLSRLCEHFTLLSN